MKFCNCRRILDIYSQGLLKFIWRDQLYAFTSLPMGFTSSHRIFTNVLKPVFSYLRSQFGHTCLGYIDDSFYQEDGYTECEEATLHAIQLFVSLGFKIHSEKSVIIPTQIFIFILNTILMSVNWQTRKLLKFCSCAKSSLFQINGLLSVKFHLFLGP